jgi:hypothetical protein
MTESENTEMDVMSGKEFKSQVLKMTKTKYIHHVLKMGEERRGKIWRG